MTRKVFRDPALQKQFDRNGFVAVPMLTEEEVARLHLEIAALRPADAWKDGAFALLIPAHMLLFPANISATIRDLARLPKQVLE